jgi:dienelactone hydrolase
VIILDYMKYFRKNKLRFGNSVPDIIYESCKHALNEASKNNWISFKSPGNIIAWSLGSEGALKIANDSLFVLQYSIKKLAVFYPSNQFYEICMPLIPVLVQTGTKDNVTRMEHILEVYSNHPAVSIKSYDGAAHGFDVSSLSKEKSLRFPPIIGPKFSLHYNGQAAEKSLQLLLEFISN